MAVTSPSARVRARKQAIQRTAERAAFVREQAKSEPPPEDPPAEGGGDEAPPG